MAKSSAQSVVVPTQDFEAATEKRKLMEQVVEVNKRVKINEVNPKQSGLWVQRSIELSVTAKPVMRKSSSVNDLWVKQTIAFVTKDM